MPSTLSTTGHTEKLLAVCRELTDHLSAYAISADRFDEDALVACEKAERLMADARRALQAAVNAATPGSLDEWLRRANTYALSRYAIDAEEITGDLDRLRDGFREGYTPEETVRFYADKYDLDPADPWLR